MSCTCGYNYGVGCVCTVQAITVIPPTNQVIAVSNGLQGLGGAQGASGSQGTQGTSVQGAQGTQGSQGAQGVGAQGTTGTAVTILGNYSSYADLIAAHPTGSLGNGYLVGGYLYVWQSNSWVNVGLLQGAQGVQGGTGTQGNQGLQGTTLQGTSGAQGTVGYQGVQGSQGLQGRQGTQGVQGPQAAQGTTGTQGATGSQGSQGNTGTQGVQGNQGTQGVQGYQGNAGIQGVQGNQGTQGNQGVQGIQGIQGATGLQGATGTQGNQGVQGVGLQGVQGALGAQGNSGTQGVQGVGSQGSQGLQGNQGTTGTQGVQGNLGVQGIQGSQGLQGLLGRGLWTEAPTATPPATPEYGDRWFNTDTGLEYTWIQDGTTGQWVDTRTSGYVGPQGIQGTQGTQGLQGVQGNIGTGVNILGSYVDYATLVAAHPTGITGDAYIVGVNLYVWASGAWSNVGQIVGPQGIQGTQGTQGTQGLQGNQGVQGRQGPQGTQGLQGPQGLQGNQGVQGQSIQGTQGVQGPQGSQGLQGNQGTQGISNQGVQGTQGPQGNQGTQGNQGVQGVQGPQGVQGVQGRSHLNITSATSTTIGTGSKTFTVTSTGDFTVGEYVLVTNTGTPTNYMFGQITAAVVDTSITINVTGTSGTGTFTAWTFGMTGIQGVQGPQGTQGNQGTQGPQGTQGLQGPQGTQGLQGPQGTQGSQGTQGLQGPQGTQGVQGVQGPQGNQGVQGTSIQGFQGAQGLIGATGNQNAHPAVNAVSTASGSGLSTYFAGTADVEAGTGIGAYIESNTNGAISSIDGVTLSVGSRVLFTGRTNSTENGIYSLTNAGSVSTKFRFTRATDANNHLPNQVESGDYVFVLAGTLYASTTWVEYGVGSQPDGSVVIGTDPILFTQAGGTGAQGTQGTANQGVQGTQGLQGLQGLQGQQGPVGSTFTLQGVNSTLLSDETASTAVASSTTESAAHKTYTINATDAANFNNFRVEAVVQSLNNFTTATNATITWRIKTAGVTSQTYIHRLTSSTTGGQQFVETISYVIGAQAASTALTITSQNSTSNANISATVLAWRVYGIADTTFGAGAQGTQGVQGPQGIQGPQGTQGVQGPQGTQGIQGPQGTQGVQGVQGRSHLNTTSTTSTTIATGSKAFTVTNSGDFNVGEYVIVTNTGTPTNYMFGQITAVTLDSSITVNVTGISGTGTFAAWTFATSGIQGVQGLQGPQGTQGTQGLQGTQGVQGPQGTQGLQGPQGTQGIQGIQSTQGPQGLQGLANQGVQGMQGLSGTSQGVQGAAGAGTTGLTPGGLVYGSSGGSVQQTIAGTAGQILMSYGDIANGGPEWVSLAAYEPVVVASTTALVGTYANNTPGTTASTFTITATGTLTIDGYLTTLGDRILIKDQLTGSTPTWIANGVYIVTTAGATGVSAVLTRDNDTDTIVKLAGALIEVERGTAAGGTYWINRNLSTDTMGTTAVYFGQVAASTAPTSTTSTNSLPISITTGAATGTTSSSGSITIQTGTGTTAAGNVVIDTGSTTGSITIGATPATITIGKTTTSTTNIQGSTLNWNDGTSVGGLLFKAAATTGAISKYTTNGTGTVIPTTVTAALTTPSLATTAAPNTTGALGYNGDRFSGNNQGAAAGLGMIPLTHQAVSAAAVSYTTTTLTTPFATANDTFTLQTSKLYYFKMQIPWTVTAFTTATTLLFSPTMTNAPVNFFYRYITYPQTGAAISTTNSFIGSYSVAGSVPVSQIISPSLTATGSWVTEIEGWFTSNATTGGTLLPQLALTANTTLTVTANQFTNITLQKLGTSAETGFGGWA